MVPYCTWSVLKVSTRDGLNAAVDAHRPVGIRDTSVQRLESGEEVHGQVRSKFILVIGSGEPCHEDAGL